MLHIHTSSVLICCVRYEGWSRLSVSSLSSVSFLSLCSTSCFHPVMAFTWNHKYRNVKILEFRHSEHLMFLYNMTNMMLFQSNEWIKTNKKNSFWCKKPWLALWVVFRGNIITYKMQRGEVAPKSANVHWRHQYFFLADMLKSVISPVVFNLHTLILMCYKLLFTGSCAYLQLCVKVIVGFSVSCRMKDWCIS